MVAKQERDKVSKNVFYVVYGGGKRDERPKCWRCLFQECVRWQGGDTEYPLAGLPIKLVLRVTHFR